MRQPSRPLGAASLVCVLLLAVPGAAQEPKSEEPPLDESEVEELDPVIVTATRAPRPVATIPGSVIVIEKEEIQKELALSSDLTNVISKRVPGFSVSNQTISGASETFRGRRVQVLVDGVARSTPLRDVSRLLSVIDINRVERIEVVNGASSIYGDGATGGVINIITRDAEQENTINLEVSSGIRAFTEDIADSLAPEGSATVSGRFGAFDYLTTLSGRLVNDTFDGAGNRLPDDPLIGQGAFANSETIQGLAKLGGSHDGRRLEFTADFVQLDQEPDFYADYDSDPVSVDFDDSYEADSIREDSNSQSLLFTDRNFLLGDLSIRAYRNDIEKRFADARLSPANFAVLFSGDLANPISEDGQTTLESLQYGVRSTVDTRLDNLVQGVLDGLAFTWGFDYGHSTTDQEFENGAEAIAPMTLDSYAAFLQTEVAPWSFLLLRGGVRYERFDLEVDTFTRPSYVVLLGGGATTVIPEVRVLGDDFTFDEFVFNLGAVAFATDELEFFAGYSRGYSLPDVGGFTRRAALGASGTVDFADIGPEAQTVDNVEAGLRFDREPFRLALSGFISWSDLGTNFDASTNEVQQQKEEVYGIEAIAEVDVLDNLTFGTVFGWREGRRDTDGNGSLDANLPNNRIGAPFRVTSYLDYRTGFDLTLRFEALYTSRRNQFDGVQKVELKPTYTFNLSASYPVLGGRLGFGVENLLDRAQENPTASATRNLAVNTFGRVVSLTYSRSF